MNEKKITHYFQEELEAMLSDLESDRVERKESFKGDAPTTVREAVCAFANDLPDHRKSGVIFIGAKDDGNPSSLEITDSLLRQLTDIKTDGNIVPPPSLTVQKQILKGKEMAVILVEPSDSPPVRYKGRTCIRIGPRRGFASVQDERILNEKRRHKDRPFDIQPVEAAVLADLNLKLFEELYLPAAVAPDILAANDRTLEQRLAATKMIVSSDNPVPTVLGVLVLSSRTRDFLPGAYIQFLRIDGLELVDPIIDQHLIDGTVQDVLRLIDEKFTAHNRTSVDFTSSPIEVRRQSYPIPALQQLIRNAVLHRTYEGTNSPVKAYWYNDRIEIINPGGPYGEVTSENFGMPGVTDYRNPNLAEALRVLGFIQRYGAGIPTARRALEINGNPPLEFKVESTNIRITVRQAK